MHLKISTLLCLIFFTGSSLAETPKGMTNTIIDTEHGIVGGFLTKDTTFQQVLDAGIPVKGHVEQGDGSEGTEWYYTTILFPQTPRAIMVMWDKHGPENAAPWDNDKYGRSLNDRIKNYNNSKEMLLPLPDAKPILAELSPYQSADLQYKEDGNTPIYPPAVWKTEKNIGVGSRASEIHAAYGDFTYWYYGCGEWCMSAVCCKADTFPKALTLYFDDSEESKKIGDKIFIDQNAIKKKTFLNPHIDRIIYNFQPYSGYNLK